MSAQTPFVFPPDICRNRHRGSPESEEANKRVEPRKTELQQTILNFAAARGVVGLTTEEAARSLGIRYTTASARISELKRDGLLVKNGDRRETNTGCTAAVLVTPEFGRTQ